jgi:anti-sigma regulatory factor (Ser/Thr protein kinase)
MNGGASARTLRAPAGVARAAEGGTGTVHGTALPAPGRSSRQSDAPVPVPLPRRKENSMTSEWPLRDFIEFGALPSAVPCARLHARQMIWEWGLDTLASSVELLVSELVTNGMYAARCLERHTPVRLWLLSDKQQVLIFVWDANPRPPARMDANTESERGRGLHLVEAVSDQWGAFPTPEKGGKAVWALVTH